MIRQRLVTAVLGMLLVTFALVGGPGNSIQAQTEDAAPTEEAAPVETAPASLLGLGERLATPAWDLQVDDFFVSPSPTRPGWSEVRVAVSLRNNTPEPMPFADDAFRSDPAYPRLEIVDTKDRRPYVLHRPRRFAVPGSTLVEIPAGLTARWTLGFQVPTAATADLGLVASAPGGVALAEWALTGATNAEAWTAPSLETVGLGATIVWEDDPALGGLVTATPVDHGSLVCGDPSTNFATQVFALQFDVASPEAPTDRLWPTATFPEYAAVAMWANGATAQVTSETFVGPAETVRRFSTDRVLIPPGDQPTSRALLFGIPRDGRFGGVTDPPIGVLLNRPNATPLWLALDAPGTLPMNPALCDDGTIPPPVPYAYAPSHRFEVTPEGVVPGLPGFETELDDAAQGVLDRGLVVVAAYLTAEGSFANVSSDALESVWPGVDFVAGFEAAAPGLVAWLTPDANEIVLVTASESGNFLCLGFDLTGEVRRSVAPDLNQSFVDQCSTVPAEPVAEEEAAAAEETTEEGG